VAIQGVLEEKQYAKPFENSPKRIHRIAVVFEYPKKRNVVVWERK
jgi:hypothetical protein